MLTKLAAVTMLPMLLVGGVVANSSIMLVEVHDGSDGFGIWVPVPLTIVQVAAVFVPDEFKRVEIPEEAIRFLPHLERMVDELEAMPDALLVEVEDGADHVKVYKSGEHFRVQVRDAQGTEVDVNVPLVVVRGVMNAFDEDGRLHASRVIGAMRAAPSGDFVRVVDGDDRVRVRMW